MYLRELYYFVTIVEESTFTAAAVKLHVTQPTLSATIKKLESRLELRLLDRTSKEITLTKEGSILYKEAKKLLIHYDHVFEEMDRIKKDGPLEIAIGSIESAKFWLPEVLVGFKELYPDIYLKIFDVLGQSDVEKALNSFEIHLAITNQYVAHPEIEVVPLYEEELVVLLPGKHELVSKEFLTVRDLQTIPFILCKEGFQTRQDVINAFRKKGIKPAVQFEIERFETACSLVEKGLGSTVVPQNYISEDSLRNMSVKRLNDPVLSRTVYLATNKNRYLPPIATRFIEDVHSYFKKV
ncbi:LysR family transcriptional regulator [Virgibacillus halodenitrificans]|uniref:LysR family transcriptional regulator n=1 Tax=Virgibacillus halodenitrificans TaxID=1482 RepID=UPI0002F837DE|nr:LysR family transcriptional regulator [Virgibacillus halodenitrificans]